MKVIIDERETELFEKCESLIRSSRIPSSVQLSKEVLNLGDVLIKTDDNKEVLLIELKSFQDLLASIKDGRYEEQSYRLLHSSGFPPHSVFYLVEGMFAQLRAPLEKKIIMSAITTMQFFKGFSVQRTSTVHESAEWLLHFAEKIERNFSKGVIPYYLTRPFRKYFTPPSREYTLQPTEQTTRTENPPTIVDESTTQSLHSLHSLHSDENTGDAVTEPVQTAADYCHVVKKVKKENVTPENIGEIILCQIPGISSVTAIAIMKHFNHFTHFIEELAKNPACIENLTTETNGKVRKISKKSIESIKAYLMNTNAAK
jgi:ERCC4-type nuclease